MTVSELVASNHFHPLPVSNNSLFCAGHFADMDAFEVEESFTDESCARDLENKITNWPLFDQLRHSDIKLLKALNVGTIVDFMVEKKKVKFGLK